MKGIKLNKITSAALLSCTLTATSLSGCIHSTSDIGCQENMNVMSSFNNALMDFETPELKVQIEGERIETIVDGFENVSGLAQKLLEESSVSVIYQNKIEAPLLAIAKTESDEPLNELSDEFYQQLNSLIREKNIKSLSFSHLNEQFDFSKVEFSNIKNLSFTDCSGTFNSFHSSPRYEEISFFDTSWQIAAGVLSNCDTSVASVYWSETMESTGNLKLLLESLIEKNNYMSTFCVNQLNNRDHQGITEDEFNLLGKINTTNLSIKASGFQEPLDLDLTLHGNVESLYLDIYDTSYSRHGEFGTIQIHSNRGIYCVFAGADITENTSFSLPSASWVTLESLKCEDLSAIHDLANVQFLLLKGNILPETEFSDDIIYCSIPGYFTENENIYRNYNEALEAAEKRLGTSKGK